MPLSIFDTTAFLIFCLFIIKYLFYRRCKSGKLSDLLLQYSLPLYRAMILSWLLLFFYLIVVRVLLGWELRWLSPVYLLYFITSLILDAYYFGLKNEMPQYSIFKNNALFKIEQWSRKLEIGDWFRMIKQFYYLISFILYAFCVYAYLLLVPIPTIDSFHFFKRYVGVCNGNDELVKSDFYYYYRVSRNDFESVGNFSIKEHIVANKLIFSEDARGDLGLYEIKAFFFRKHIISFPENTGICYFVDDILIPFQYAERELVEYERDKKIANEGRLKYFELKKKINFDTLYKYGYFQDFNELGMGSVYSQKQIDSISRYFEPSKSNRIECVRIKMKKNSIDIEIHCEESKTLKSKFPKSTYIVYRINC